MQFVLLCCGLRFRGNLVSPSLAVRFVVVRRFQEKRKNDAGQWTTVELIYGLVEVFLFDYLTCNNVSTCHRELALLFIFMKRKDQQMGK